MFGADGGFFESAGGEVEALGGAQFARRSEFFQGFAPRVIGGSSGGYFHLKLMLPCGLGFNVDFKCRLTRVRQRMGHLESRHSG